MPILSLRPFYAAASLLGAALVPAPVQAATLQSFDIRFYEETLVDSTWVPVGGHAGADWFGSLTVDFGAAGAFKPLVAFDATIGALRFDHLPAAFPSVASLLDSPGDIFDRNLVGFVLQDELVGPTTALQFGAYVTVNPDGSMAVDGRRLWALGDCRPSGCGGGAYKGRYELTERLAVPTPPSLLLSASALLLAAGLRRRR